MAQMIPPTPGEAGDERVPYGEQEVFTQLKKHTPDDWLVLHSLRLKNHEFKKSGEADFVVITDQGVLVIEVKGGKNYRNKAGKWVQEKRGKPDREKNESPFKQTMDAYFAIERYLKKAGHKELTERLPWGWGVIMPHCIPELPEDDPEIDHEMLLDQKHFPEGLVDWTNSLVEYWREDNNRKKFPRLRNGRQMQNGLPPTTRDELKELLRPRVECYTGLGQATREAEQSLIRLTEKQCQLLIATRSKSTPRAIIEGAAGTGKTLLAFEFAKECAVKGEKVLLVCYNVNLARLLQSKAAQFPEMATVTIDNYHQLVKGLRNQAGLTTTFSSDWGDFNQRCFDLVAEAIDSLGDAALFDRIIMDEGQDLMSEAFLDVLDLLLKDGLTPPPDEPRKGGKWLVAMDRAQALYTNNFEEKALDRLERYTRATLELVENCRNTRPVAIHVYGFSKAGSCEVMTVEGPAPVIDYFSNQKTFIKLLRSYINDTLREYAKVDQSPFDIAILTARKDLIPDILFEPGMLNRPLKRYRDANKTDIVWETIHGFKGLEASTVILIGVEELADEQMRQLMYVGGSRARTRLIWLLPEDCSNSVQAGLLEVQKQLTEEIDP
ncbi:NERD domain-containing family protein [Paraglaciecola sp. T6c]|uniref:nuclease-related domain-containing DEAD/DEAH box helicase n=1 Tax=Pseudoalteromonas atlantica (strain T6c / ATCC BAA-1087) TaxID=3042615 RepID=UPI00005C566A|nr:NERD domain-containing protein [Paraglaciecola sp. T6c]ABG42598.1 NERD domain-containing family protein [Paraglaciecola sp. T6c]